MTTHTTLVLASASPARLQTLRAAGLDPEVMVSGVDESIVDSSVPQTLCATLARLKAEAVVTRIRQHTPVPSAGTVVLGCDSVLESGGQVLGKPADRAEAETRWRRMRGTSGVLHTGHCLVRVDSGEIAEAVSSTTVRFGEVTDEEITSYVASGEPLHVAGAFTIDGLGGWFVEAIEGDHGTVIGVSLPVLRRLLAALGISVTRLWPASLSSRT
jgi:septum formation protein